MLIMQDNSYQSPVSHTNKRRRQATSLNIAELEGTSNYKRKKNKTAKDKQWWTTLEDERLRKAVSTCGAKNWKLISEMANVGKSDVQCLQRWTQVLRPGLKKGTWSKEEDAKLTEKVTKLLKTSKQVPWKKLEKEMGGRTAKQCRERWKLSLDPNINKTLWNKDEDEQLLKLQAELGNSWSRIKDLLGTNRTENAVKLRYKCLKKREEKYQKNISQVHTPLHIPQPLCLMPARTKSFNFDSYNHGHYSMFDTSLEFLDIKTEPLGVVGLEKFDSVKTSAFDEVLQMLSEDDASETSSM